MIVSHIFLLDFTTKTKNLYLKENIPSATCFVFISVRLFYLKWTKNKSLQQTPLAAGAHMRTYMHALEYFWELLYMGKNPTGYILYYTS